MDEDIVVDGLSLKVWQAAFRPGINEFAASTFIFSQEDNGSIRVAFGNSGPRVNQSGLREPVFTHAVTLTPSLAVDLAGMLLKHYAQPKS